MSRNREYEKNMNVENEKEILQITKFEKLKEYSKGQIVRLPDFAEGQPFIARIRKPSMLSLIKDGLIPNELLTSANSLFMEGADSFDPTEQNSLSNMFKVIESICEASFVEPTYQEIKESGIELTDAQLMFMFAYSQDNVRALKSFRNE